MRHQDVCLEQQDRDIVNSRAQLEQLLFKQEFITSKICQLKTQKCNKKTVELPSIEDGDTQTQRITALEEEIKDIRSKIGTSASKRRTDTTPSSDHSSEAGNGREEEMWEELQKYAQQMAESRSHAEQEKDSLQLQMTSVNSQLFHAKLSASTLAKEKLVLQSELSASRNINESLLLEVASLRQNMHSLEESVAGVRSKETLCDVQIRDLTEENKQLLSQKKLLLETLKTRRAEPEQEDVLAKSDREQHQGNQDVHIRSELNSNEDGKEPYVKTRKSSSERDPSSGKTRCPEGCSRDRGKQAKLSSKRSEDRGSREKYNIPRQKMSRLLRKLEGLLTCNVKVKQEKEQILKDLLGVLTVVKDAETSSEQRRKEVESLLGEHVHLEQNFHDRENQIMAVIMELQHIRKAYEGALKNSFHPDEKMAMGWVTRVSLIKNCLDKLQDHRQKTGLLEQEKSLMMDQLKDSALKT